MRSVFNQDNSDAILLVDATNAFNSLNHSVALHNIQQLCPSLACVLSSTYRSPTSLFVSGDTIPSEEGTTQDDPLAIPMYAIAMIPLLRHITDIVTQVWYADDACTCGRLSSLCQWCGRTSFVNLDQALAISPILSIPMAFVGSRLIRTL